MSRNTGANEKNVDSRSLLTLYQVSFDTHV